MSDYIRYGQDNMDELLFSGWKRKQTTSISTMHIPQGVHLLMVRFIHLKDTFQNNIGYSIISARGKSMAVRNMYGNGTGYKNIGIIQHEAFPHSNQVTTWELTIINFGQSTVEKRADDIIVGVQSEGNLSPTEDSYYFISRYEDTKIEHCYINLANERVHSPPPRFEISTDVEPIKVNDIITIQLISFQDECTIRFYTNGKFNFKRQLNSFNKSDKKFNLFICLGRKDATVELSSVTQNIYHKTIFSLYDFHKLINSEL